MIYAPTRYRYNPDTERRERLPELGCEFCESCGDDIAEDELDEDGLCEQCR